MDDAESMYYVCIFYFIDFLNTSSGKKVCARENILEYFFFLTSKHSRRILINS